ncbi:TPA: Tn7-like element transposition protein TnsE, partial [Enterobacter hormaechei]
DTATVWCFRGLHQNWPNSLFDQLYGQDGHRGVNHPKGLGELQVSREDMEGWAERVVREQFTH